MQIWPKFGPNLPPLLLAPVSVSAGMPDLSVSCLTVSTGTVSKSRGLSWKSRGVWWWTAISHQHLATWRCCVDHVMFEWRHVAGKWQSRGVWDAQRYQRHVTTVYQLWHRRCYLTLVKLHLDGETSVDSVSWCESPKRHFSLNSMARVHTYIHT